MCHMIIFMTETIRICQYRPLCNYISFTVKGLHAEPLFVSNFQLFGIFQIINVFVVSILIIFLCNIFARVFMLAIMANNLSITIMTKNFPFVIMILTQNLFIDQSAIATCNFRRGNTLHRDSS